MLKKGSSGGIYIHPWDITDEGIDDCFDFLGDDCGLNELFIAAVYHANTFLLPHNPKRLVRWDDGGIHFTPQHPRWRETRIRPVIGDSVDTSGYLANIVDNARRRDWGVLFFTVFHLSHSTAHAFPDACPVDAMGERQRAALCPGNPDVRAYDLAIVSELMETYGGDGIRLESLGFMGWNSICVIDKVETMPSPRDQFLLSLCFCGSCMQRARDEGFDAVELRRAVRDHLFDSIPRNPTEWDMGTPDEEWARNAFGGQLWKYMEVRCNTVTSLFVEIQEIITKNNGAFMPFGLSHDRNIMGGRDLSQIYPHLRRVSLGLRGETLDEKKRGLIENVKKVPDYAEPEIMHNQRGFGSMEDLRDTVMTAREGGVRHHSFHYYGMSRRHELERIGHAREAWA